MHGIRNVLLGTTLAVSLAAAAGSAFAADMMMPAKAVAPIMAPNDEGLYISVFGGAAFSNELKGRYTTSATESAFFPLKTGYVIGGAIGTHLAPHLRGDVEISYAAHSVADFGWYRYDTGNTGPEKQTGSINSLYLLGNLWYDFDTIGSVMPYIGGGVGAAVIMPNFVFGSWDYSSDAIVPAAQLGAGVKLQLADNIELDLGYRVKAAFNATFKQPAGSRQSDFTGITQVDQTVQAGLTFGF